WASRRLWSASCTAESGLRSHFSQYQDRDHRGKRVAPRTDRGCRTGEKLCREDGDSPHLFQQWPGRLRHRHGDRQGRREAWPSHAFQIAWKLFNARWNLKEWKRGAEPTRRPRILFLADRNNLADQAFNDFTSFAAFSDDALVRIKPEDIRKKGKVPKNASLFF